MTMPLTRILIIQPLPGMGDIAWFDAHIQTIKKRFPHSHITLLTKASSRGKEVLSAASYVSSVDYLDSGEEEGPKSQGILGPLSLAQHLKQASYDQAWVFHKSWRYVWGCRLAKIPHIYTYDGYYVNGLKQGDSALTPQDMRRHPIDRTTALLERHGFAVDQTVACGVDESLVAQMALRFVDAPRPWIVLGIGGSEPQKKWPSLNVAALGERLYGRYGGALFILGGAQETREGDKVAQTLHVQHIPCHVVTEWTIPESIAFLSQTDLFVGNDTGMMNLAAILNKPTVGLFLASPVLCYRPQLYPISPILGDVMDVDTVYARVMDVWRF